MFSYERFKKVRKTLKLTQKQFAEELGLSQAHLSGIENGKENASLMLIKLISAKYGVNEEWLSDEKGQMFLKDNNFDIETMEGLNVKYLLMKDFLEKQIAEQSTKNLKNIVQSYSHFVSILTMPGLTEDNQTAYLDSIFNLINSLEAITYSSYLLKNKSKKDYESLLKYKTNVDRSINKIDENIKKALSCFLIQFNIDLALDINFEKVQINT